MNKTQETDYYFPKCHTSYGSRCEFPAHPGSPPVCREHTLCSECREHRTYCKCPDHSGFPPSLRCPNCDEYVMRHTTKWKAVADPAKQNKTVGWYQCATCDHDLTEPAIRPIKSIPFRLSDYSPNTNMIVGALLSGGDPLKMAQLIVDAQEKSEAEIE